MTISAIQGNSIPIEMKRPDQQLSENQKEVVATILSQYDSENLTIDEARLINNTFRDTGLKRSKGLQNAIESAGFSGKAISALDPPPPEKSQAGKIDGPSQGHFRMDKEVLETFQDILSGYDLNVMTSKQENEMVIQLKQAGLFFPGLLINDSV